MSRRATRDGADLSYGLRFLIRKVKVCELSRE